jgi:hypothetical protein
MKTVWAALFCTALVMGSAADGGQPAPPTGPPPVSGPASPGDGRLEQLVAPIALYPDDLLGQILMAAAYPLEVVEAARWRQDPSNVDLESDALATALQDQSWDPSVKSLTAWPQVLAMMDGQIEWTEALGEAFINEPAAVMDAVQRLRAQAQAAGRLESGREMTVSDDNGDIDIAPAEASTVYAPTYDPGVVFGPWGWPDYPPFTFSGWYDGCEVGDLGWCWAGFPIYSGFWGWDSFDWRGHRLSVDNGRWGGGRGVGAAGASGRGVWAYDPAHRHGVPYQTAGGPERFDNHALDVAAQRTARGFSGPERAEVGGAEPGRAGFESGGPERAGLERGGPERADPERADAESADRRAGYEPRPAPTFESYGSGAEARAWSQRGFASRTSSFGGSSFHGGGFSGGGARGGGHPR